MNAMVQIYKRYFRNYKGALVVMGICFVIAAGESSMMSAISRYLVDDVMEVNLMLEPMLHGQPRDFVDKDIDLPNIPRDKMVSSREIADKPLPAEMSNRKVLTADIPADGALADRIQARPGKPTALKLQLLFWVVVIMFTVHFLAIGIQTYGNVLMCNIPKQIVLQMRMHMHEKLMRLQLSFHNQHQTGRLMSRAIDDMQVIESNFANVMTTLATIMGLLIINISIMFYISPKLTMISLVVMPFYFYAHKVLCDKIRVLQRGQRKKNAALYGFIRDRLANPRIIKGFGQEKRELINFFVRSKGIFRDNRKIVVLNNTLSMICTVIAVLATAVPLAYGVMMVKRGELTVGYLLFFYGVSWGLFWPIAVLSITSAWIQMLRISCERVLEILDEPIIIADRPDSKPLESFTHEITIRDLSFRYSEKHPAALQDINLTIRKGQKICLMGSSGAGKSTLGVQLLRLYDPTSGHIVVDGVNLKDIKISSWRQRISCVPQEPILFSGTLASNILYGNSDATREQMIAAAKAAEIHDFIESLPEKYETVIGENGMRLSGGQKQRISLARALVTDPDILVLDDCTSALDAETESRIQRTFKNALSGKTVIMISHRVSAASNADMVVVLDHGKIVETGVHQELFEKKGYYWGLVKDQLSQHHILPTPDPCDEKSKCAAA
jgi:ABC-type multidrug transport system fused ATPase/permease subunit